MTQSVPHKIIAARVKEVRKRRGWSAARLAEEMSRVGFPWDRSLIANFEGGRRAILSVDELLALAYCLSVAPIHLVVPPHGVDTFEVVPGVVAPVGVVRDWFRGYLEPFGDPRAYVREMPDQDMARFAEAVQRHADRVPPMGGPAVSSTPTTGTGATGQIIITHEEGPGDGER